MVAANADADDDPNTSQPAPTPVLNILRHWGNRFSSILSQSTYLFLFFFPFLRYNQYTCDFHRLRTSGEAARRGVSTRWVSTRVTSRGGRGPASTSRRTTVSHIRRVSTRVTASGGGRGPRPGGARAGTRARRGAAGVPLPPRRQGPEMPPYVEVNPVQLAAVEMRFDPG